MVVSQQMIYISIYIYKIYIQYTYTWVMVTHSRKYNSTKINVLHIITMIIMIIIYTYIAVGGEH